MLFKPRPKGLGKDNFLKLGDGEEVTGIFRGEIHSFRRHWIQSTQRSEECAGEGCPICARGTDENPMRPTFRFRINFITSQKDGGYVAKIFEGGGDLYDQLVMVDKKFDLAKTVVDITRQGTKQNTRFQVMPRPDMPVNKEFEARLAKVQLLPLSADVAEEGGKNGEEKSS